MAYRSVEVTARPSVRAGRAARPRVKPDTQIAADRLQGEWERGTLWAGIAMALTFGPMLAWGIYWGWV